MLKHLSVAKQDGWKEQHWVGEKKTAWVSIWMSPGHKRAYITGDWWVANVTRRFRQKDSMMQQAKKIWSAILLASFCYGEINCEIMAMKLLSVAVK